MAQTPSSSFSQPPLRVLVAEDGFTNRQLALRLLEREGHLPTLVRDGALAVSELRRRHFDVVLMDVEMPGMDGLAATRAIRARERGTGRRTLIIALTSNTDSEKCLAAGMDAFLSKPLRIRALREVLKALLPKTAA
jgi:CheY-like chemotaxis protein